MADLGTPRGGVNQLRTQKLAHTAAVVLGEVIVSGGNVLIACNAADADADNAYIFRGPVEFAKEAALAMAADAVAYWNATDGEMTTAKGISVAAPVADGGNTGNGVCTLATPAFGASAVAETWTLICTAAAADAGTFSVVGSVSGRMADATVAVAYDNGHIKFTIADGAADFVVGDKITIAVTQANTKAGMVKEAAAAADTVVLVELAENK